MIPPRCQTTEERIRGLSPRMQARMARYVLAGDIRFTWNGRSWWVHYRHMGQCGTLQEVLKVARLEIEYRREAPDTSIYRHGKFKRTPLRSPQRA